MPYITRKKVKLLRKKPLVLKIELADDALPKHYDLDTSRQTFLYGTLTVLVDKTNRVKDNVNREFKSEVKSSGHYIESNKVVYDRYLPLPKDLVSDFAIDEGDGIELVLDKIVTNYEIKKIFSKRMVKGSMDFELMSVNDETKNGSKLPFISKFTDSRSIVFGYIEKIISELHNGIKWKSYEKLKIEFEKLNGFLKYIKSQLPNEFVAKVFTHIDQHLHFMERYIDEKKLDMIEMNFNAILDRDLPNIKTEIVDYLETQEVSKQNKKEKLYPKGYEYDVYRDILAKIKNAKIEIFVIDAYVNEELLNLYLEKIPKQVKIRILTNKPKGNFITVAKKYKGKPNVDFEVRQSSDCHDRLFFLDDECWAIGQSVKDAGRKPTYLIRIEGYAFFKNVFDNLWNNASKLL